MRLGADVGSVSNGHTCPPKASIQSYSSLCSLSVQTAILVTLKTGFRMFENIADEEIFGFLVKICGHTVDCSDFTSTVLNFIFLL